MSLSLVSRGNPWEGGTFVRSASGSFPSSRAFFFPLVLGLDLQVAYHSALTGTVKDITQTRVSHHSEPLEVAEPDTVSGVWSAVLNKPYRAAAIREFVFCATAGAARDGSPSPQAAGGGRRSGGRGWSAGAGGGRR